MMVLLCLSPTASSPTSFEGSYGKIIYRVRAFIETPRFAKDYSTEKPFYLLSLLNLNELPDIWVSCSGFFYRLVLVHQVGSGCGCSIKNPGGKMKQVQIFFCWEENKLDMHKCRAEIGKLSCLEVVV